MDRPLSISPPLHHSSGAISTPSTTLGGMEEWRIARRYDQSYFSTIGCLSVNS